MGRIQTKRIAAAALIAGVLLMVEPLVAGATTQHSQSTSHKSKSLTTVTFTVAAPVAEQLLPYFAQSEGIFRKYGIYAQFVPETATTILSAFAAGQIDFASIAAPQPDIANLQGIPLKWLAVWADYPDLDICAGPGITSMSQLAGKKIAITAPGSATDVLGILAMKKSHVNPNSVITVPVVGVGGQAAAFLSGQVDAFACGPPLTSQVLAGRPGSSLIYQFAKERVLWPFAGLAGNMTWVNNHKKTTENVVRAIVEAVRVWKSSPVAAQALIRTETNATQTQAWESYQSSLHVLSLRPIPSLKAERDVLSVIASLSPRASTAKPSSLIDTTFVDTALAR